MANFTRYKLRKRSEALGIEVRYEQFDSYIEKGLLPDPALEAWTEEEIVPRYLRVHELSERSWSLDRRVVIIYLERYPVPIDNLRDAMIGMLPSIEKPVRKMNRVAAAGRWFSAAQDQRSTIKNNATLPPGWKSPKRSEWTDILQAADLDVFSQRLGISQYFASLLATFGKGTPHALDDLDPEEKLVLLMIDYLAARQWFQREAQGRTSQTQRQVEGRNS